MVEAMRVKPEISHEEERDWTESEPISSCGTLDIALQYFFTEKKLQIIILHAKDLPSKDRGGASIIQVRLRLFVKYICCCMFFTGYRNVFAVIRRTTFV